MTLDQETRGEVAILRPLGRLDSSTSPELERAVLEHLEAGCQRMVFDLADMDYVSSAGLRVILLAGKKLRATKGKLVLSGMREMVREVFEMSGFLNLFAVTANLDDALTQF
jgi:anti-anti-sigma factor